MQKEIHYWRQDSFEKIEVLQRRLAEHSELAPYVEYLNYLERGLRRQALGYIRKLIEDLKKLDVERQRELTSILCRENETSPGHKLIPYPLWVEFINPVITSWIECDSNAAEPRRWTGKIDDLKHAVELDSSCDYTRWRLVMRILGHVGFSTHELPFGYLGDIEKDEDLLILAGCEAKKLKNKGVRDKCLKLIQEEHEEIETYKSRRV